MSIKEIQKKLKELGYYKGKIDGINGVQTKSATKKFQKKYKLVVDGIAGAKTQAKLKSLTKPKKKSKAIFSFQNDDGSINWGKVEKFGFKKSEFYNPKDKFTPKAGVNIYLLNMLINIRKKFGAVVITSGVRSQRYNDSLKGSIKNSKHIKGKAADIYVRGATKKQVMDYVRKQKNYNHTYSNSSNMGNAVHVDVK